ncbi:MAG: choice-of-anchor D domain-containing protein [Terriglobia bacterium]
MSWTHYKGGIRQPWLRALAVAVAVAWGSLAWASAVPASSAKTAKSTKLATVLADLVSTPTNQTPAERAAQPSGFSLATAPKSVRDAVHTRLMRINAHNEVQVYILMSAVNDENLGQLRARGVSVEYADPAHRRVQARIPIAQLQTVAGLPFVNFIRLPNYAIRMTGSVNTEGDAILRSSLARTQTGVDGTGVRVGVISDGLKGVFATGCTTCAGVTGGPISTEDLPAATGTRNASGVLTSSSGGINGRSFAQNNDLEGLIPGCAFAGAGAEGTALLEIIHDIAPGAQLSFANADTDTAFNNAVNFLAASNDVVVDDLGFVGLPYDGTSAVSANTAAALNNNSNRIRGYFTSAGNFADEHYFGAYTDSNVAGNTISGITNSGHLHQFQSSADTVDTLNLGPKPYNVIKLCAQDDTANNCFGNSEVLIFLTWNDPFGGSSNDYDLFLVDDSTGAVVASSEDPQSGTQDPLEWIHYANDTGATGFFRIVVQNFNNSATAKNLSIFSFQPECASDGPRRLDPSRHERLNFNTATKSVPAQSDSGGSPVSVVSVGAICSASDATQTLFGGDPTRDESCFDTTHSTIEFFSSRGPTLDGRNKPDISAIDGVSITGAGNFPCDASAPNCHDPFFGTSAAAPHMAGIAALTLQGAPCLLKGSTGALADPAARGNLRSLLVDNAAALYDPGAGTALPNNMFGTGRADALATLLETLPIFNGSSSIQVNGTSAAGASLTSAQIDFIDPDNCPLTTMNWTTTGGNCGTGPGASMTCGFGSNSVSVSASNNGVSFSEPADVQIVVTNFDVGVSPSTQTVTAGQSADYTVTVSGVGGPYTIPITLACANLPAESSCSFNPPSVTPGGTSAVSTLTITTLPRPPAAAAPTGNGFPNQQVTRPYAPMAWLAAFVVVMTLGWVFVRFPARRQAAAGAGIIVAGVMAIQLSCGGGGGGPSTPPAPAVSLTPSTLTFASQGYGIESAPQAVTLRNSGTAALSITSIAASGDFAQSNNCNASLAARSSCTINVTFTPTAAGSRTGAVAITDNASNSPQSITLTGAGSPGTVAGTYNAIQVKGTAGALVNSSASVTLTVQ